MIALLRKAGSSFNVCVCLYRSGLAQERLRTLLIASEVLVLIRRLSIHTGEIPLCVVNWQLFCPTRSTLPLHRLCCSLGWYVHV